MQPDDLDDLSGLMDDVLNINTNYRAFIESTKVEVARMEKVFNAQLLSRTGFVFQEIKDLEQAVVTDINTRRDQVSNQDCINAAATRLIDASAKAGTNSMSTYFDIIQRVEFARFLKVYPVLTELSRLVSSFIVEPFSTLAYFNPVTDFTRSNEALTQQLAVMVELFEAFVSEVIDEMTSLNDLHQELSGVLIVSLEETRLEFSTSAREIRSLLIDECN